MQRKFDGLLPQAFKLFAGSSSFKAIIKSLATYNPWPDTSSFKTQDYKRHIDEHMENLSLHDGGPQPPSGMSPAPAPVPQLPPQMFTTAAQLLDLTDKKLMISLRDGRKLIGVLRSWDQFGNLVLQDTVERLFVQNLYADIERGLFLVRGENVLLLGEIDLDKDDYVPEPFEVAPVEKVFALKKAEDQERKKSDKKKHRKLAAFGFEGEHQGETIL